MRFSLSVPDGFCPQPPVASGILPENGCALGIDIGSTSTDLVLVGRDGTLVDYQYLRTSGDPEAAVKTGLSSIQHRFGKFQLLAVGVTGSGRERIGRMIGADLIRDEITAQAKGATFHFPDTDTIFEIGGQDSKYIQLKNGEVVGFQMNKVCAAGTGSFIEEQAARMDIPLNNFGPLALSSKNPAQLGERCTVFIETAITDAAASQVPAEDLAAGLCFSIVENYLHKVVGNNPVGKKIILQGGVCYNPAIIAAFYSVYGDRLSVNPYFPISGAIGTALLAMESVGNGVSSFHGFENGEECMERKVPGRAKRNIQQNIELYRQSERLLLEGYSGRRDPGRKTVGIPFAMMIHKFFPMANAFFSSLGFNVLLTSPTDEDTIRLSQEYARGETCYPVKLIYGHMRQLIDQKVDYIFLPSIHTMKHESSSLEHNYGCVYMQTAAESVANALDLEKHGITLLNPVFDLDFGQTAMASAMLSLGKILGVSQIACGKALLSGAVSMRKHTAAVEKQGQALLKSLNADEKVLVLITRNYGISDPILNMGIPELLLERGYKVITLSHLPAHNLDIHGDYPNLYWPFGQHILSGARIVASNPNLYAIYLTNHGCGPDTMLSHLFRQEMGDKPYLQIEVDEHFSRVGVITRIEAFLNSLTQRKTVAASAEKPAASEGRHPDIFPKPDKSLPLYLPELGYFSDYLQLYWKKQSVRTYTMPVNSEDILSVGRSYTVSKEYLPFTALLGSVLSQQEKNRADAVQYFLPQTMGAEADGMYARVIYGILKENGAENISIVAPILEKLPSEADDIHLLFRALMTGDLLYAAPAILRRELASESIPDWEQLMALAVQISAIPVSGKRIAAVGTPLSLTELDESILDTLDAEGETILRAPLSEMLWFLWNENGADPHLLASLSSRMNQISSALGSRNTFSTDLKELKAIAEHHLPDFAGGNGRYRYAKAMQMGKHASAVLTLAPRYENTAMVLEMRQLAQNCPAPLYPISLDHDWDESSWTRLRSFLYYC